MSQSRRQSRLAKKFLSQKSGFLLEPSQKPNKSQIRKELIKAARAVGFNRVDDTPYRRKKFYDVWTEKIAKIQSQDKLDGRSVKTINNMMKDWRSSREFDRISKPVAGNYNVDRFVTDQTDLFNWMKGFKSIKDIHPDFNYQVNIPDTKQIWKGSAVDISSNQTAITAQAKARGSNFGGYRIDVDLNTNTVHITFTKPVEND
jgi:hypothetical protein